MLGRALFSGTVASVLSTAVASLLSRRRSGAAAGATNATSHWLWGRRAYRRDRVSMRYTAIGYAIHHASSVFWACFFERALLSRRAGDGRSRSPRGGDQRALTSGRIAATAAATTVAAYFVDYRVVPQRLTPGFESRLPLQDRALVYAAFAVGLGLGACLRARARRRNQNGNATAGAGRSSGDAGDGARAFET